MCLIEHYPGCCDGNAVIVGSRFPVWLVIKYSLFVTAERFVSPQYFPNLTVAQFNAAVDYYRAHPAEIEQNIRENQGEKQVRKVQEYYATKERPSEVI